jgi:hypothetical protein
MFILDQKAFADNTTENIDAFVNCWSSFYNEIPGCRDAAVVLQPFCSGAAAAHFSRADNPFQYVFEPFSIFPRGYRTWFAKLKITLEIISELSTENIRRAKRLGDALMAFGQFPAKYVVD